jgi:hypothetical protein
MKDQIETGLIQWLTEHPLDHKTTEDRVWKDILKAAWECQYEFWFDVAVDSMLSCFDYDIMICIYEGTCPLSFGVFDKILEIKGAWCVQFKVLQQNVCVCLEREKRGIKERIVQSSIHSTCLYNKIFK